jgi:hypothetical protein
MTPEVATSFLVAPGAKGNGIPKKMPPTDGEPKKTNQKAWAPHWGHPQKEQGHDPYLPLTMAKTSESAAPHQLRRDEQDTPWQTAIRKKG